MTHLSDTNVRRQLRADRETCKHRSGGYLEPSLFMPHLTRTSAVLTCAEQCSRSSRLVLRTATTRGFVSGARRRHCPGNASIMQENAHETPAALTAKTPRFGLQIRRIFARPRRSLRLLSVTASRQPPSVTDRFPRRMRTFSEQGWADPECGPSRAVGGHDAGRREQLSAMAWPPAPPSRRRGL